MRSGRRTVTVLFADVSGSTELGESLDPEALRDLMSTFFEEMRGAIVRHGGTVEKFAGDEVMAVFGAPVAHEDDALRAIRAVDEMLRRSRRSTRRSNASAAFVSGCESGSTRVRPSPARRPPAARSSRGRR